MVRKYNTTLECHLQGERECTFEDSVEMCVWKPTEYCHLVETENTEERDCGQNGEDDRGWPWQASPDCKTCPEVTEENCRYAHINCLRQDPFIGGGGLEECGPDQNTRKLSNKSADN